MTPDLAHLRALAEVATPGPWRTEPDPISGASYFIAGADDDAPSMAADHEPTARYIAAISPDVMLALLARLRDAECERDEAKLEAAEARSLASAREDERLSAVAARDEARAALADTEARHAREWLDAIVRHEQKRDEESRLRAGLERRAESAEARVAELIARNGELVDRALVAEYDLRAIADAAARCEELGSGPEWLDARNALRAALAARGTT